jgi:virulence factor Mce-like protein
VTPKTRTGSAVFSTVAFLCVVAIVIAAAAAFETGRPAPTKFTAMLKTVIGLYPNADVRVLGVPVGRVDSVEPQGRLVKVDFHVDSGTQVPANASAVVVAPTVVADRYLQLTPVYTGGPTMPSGTVIPADRTASPAEFDDLLASTQKLASALGPQGVNNTGALSQALTTLSRNLKGNGQLMNTSLGNVAQAVNTLSASREDIAGTVRNLQSFTTNLKDNDGQVRAFTQQFAQVSGYLAGERENLGKTLEELSKVLGEVATFVRDNRKGIKTNVDRLGEVLGTVNGERLALDQALDTAQFGLDGLVNGYNAGFKTLDTRTNLVGSLVCSIFNALNGLLNDPNVGTLGPILQAVIGLITQPILDLLPGGGGCTGVPTLPIPLPQLPAALSALKLPASTTAALRSAAALPSTGTAARGGAPAGGALLPAQRQQGSSPQPQVRKQPPSLDRLFGGGR